MPERFDVEHRLPQTRQPMRPCRRTSLLQVTVQYAIMVLLRDPLLALVRPSLLECRQNSHCSIPIRLIGIVPALSARTNTDVLGTDADYASYRPAPRRANNVLRRSLPQQLGGPVLQFSNLGSLHACGYFRGHMLSQSCAPTCCPRSSRHPPPITSHPPPITSHQPPSPCDNIRS